MILDTEITEAAIPGARAEWLHGEPYRHGESMIDRVARTRSGIVNGRPVEHDGDHYIPIRGHDGTQYLICTTHIALIDAS